MAKLRYYTYTAPRPGGDGRAYLRTLAGLIFHLQTYLAYVSPIDSNMTTPQVLILDNGAYNIKAGISGVDWEPR